MAKVYKIQRGRLFSSGQLRPKWTRQGKLFETKRGLENHLRLVQKNCQRHQISWPYHGCKVKTFTRYIKSEGELPLEDFLHGDPDRSDNFDHHYN